MKETKKLWARVGMSFDITDTQYKELAFNNAHKNGEVISELIKDMAYNIDGEIYFPEDCEDNPDYEISIDCDETVNRLFKPKIAEVTPESREMLYTLLKNGERFVMVDIDELICALDDVDWAQIYR